MYLFFAFNPVVAIIAVFFTYMFEVLIDNTYARLTWHFTVKSSWLVAVVLGVVNLFILTYFVR